MNEEMKYLAQELEDFLHRGHKLLERIKGQSMGQRRGGYGRMGYRDNEGRWDNGGDMGERGWSGGMGGYDPRYM